jgi:hypothetical protein
MERTCIWCQKIEPSVTFVRPAHIFPQSLGGKRICKNVCDSCNSYFGNKQSGLPSIEIALKEPLNISKIYLLSQVDKTKKPPRFKSEYFDYDITKQLIKPKYKYRLISDFQDSFTRQFRRGIYKVFLEERSESIGDALDEQFNFIREFARFGVGDCPAFYCRPNIPAVFASTEDLNNPVIRFTDHSEEIMKQYGFYSYYFMSHEIAIPVIRAYQLTLQNYANFLLKGEKPMYDKIIPLRHLSDLDFIFAFAFNK